MLIRGLYIASRAIPRARGSNYDNLSASHGIQSLEDLQQSYVLAVDNVVYTTSEKCPALPTVDRNSCSVPPFLVTVEGIHEVGSRDHKGV